MEQKWLVWRDEQVDNIMRLCEIYKVIREKCTPEKQERLIPTSLEDIYQISQELFETCVEG